MRSRPGWRGLAAAVLLAGSLLAATPVPEPAGPSDVRALARVRSELEAGQLEKALQLLSGLEPGLLADHVALLRARLLRGQARHEEAIAAAHAGLQRNPPSELRAELHREIARSYIDRQQLLEAYEQQHSAWEASAQGERAAALVAELAQAFDAAGLFGEALPLYRRVWSDWPLAAVADAAFERSEALTQATGAAAAPAYSLLERAHRLRKSFRCERALALYARVLERAAELDASAQQGARAGRAQCLFDTRRYAEAAQAYHELDAARKDRSNVDAAIGVARSYARLGRDAEALEEFARIRRRADAEGRARCDYFSAIVVQSTQPARYRELLRRVEKQRASPSLAQAARWNLAWADIESGHPQLALKRLEALARGPLDDIEVQRARYWRALAQRDPEARSAQLRELVEAVPLSYYGMLAADRMQTAPEAVRPVVGERPPPQIHERALRGGWLVDAGFPELALLELESWLAPSGLTRDQRLQASALLHALGDHYRAVQIVTDGFATALERGVDPQWREAWQLAWPQPYDSWVRSAVEEFGFDPALVYAVMREESTYRPDVESPAGAIGLMQLIPPTASTLAQQLGLTPFEAGRLRQPELNIRLGTYYLKSLVGRFQGSQPLAIAAYNAGPDAVERWLRQRSALPSDAFVESVPFGETRRYLRRVLRSQRMYRLLYDNPAGPVPPPAAEPGPPVAAPL
jgi:soluble lytic murein transglycosylase